MQQVPFLNSDGICNLQLGIVQLTFTCSKSIVDTLEKLMKYVQS